MRRAGRLPRDGLAHRPRQRRPQRFFAGIGAAEERDSLDLRPGRFPQPPGKRLRQISLVLGSGCRCDSAGGSGWRSGLARRKVRWFAWIARMEWKSGATGPPRELARRAGGKDGCTQGPATAGPIASMPRQAASSGGIALLRTNEESWCKDTWARLAGHGRRAGAGRSGGHRRRADRPVGRIRVVCAGCPQRQASLGNASPAIRSGRNHDRPTAAASRGRRAACSQRRPIVVACRQLGPGRS